MATADVHPVIADLEAFTLDGDSLAAVDSHVADCPTCQESAAAASPDTLVELLRRVHTLVSASQTSAPVPASIETVTLAHIAPTGPNGTEDFDVTPPVLARHERYRVLRLRGAGGMGAVYEAEHRVMRRAVAIKVINRAYTTKPAAVQRFRREVRAAARLAHANIVTTYDAEDAGDSLFLVMEYAEGMSLARLVMGRGPLPAAEACDCVRQAALGLQHAHERGMVHRDIKPDNLIRCADGTVKILDFGLAVLTAERGDDGLTGPNVVMGTPDYLAPEQAEDARVADARSDVYSLGCTLYYLLTGTVPYPAATTLLKILAHRERPVPSLRNAVPDIQPDLAIVVERMLAKKPADRYQTAGEVAGALAAVSTESAPGTRNLPREPRRRWAIAAALLFAGLIGSAGVVFSIKTDNGTIEIQTDDEDVKVIAERNGKHVTVIDPKSKQTWVVDTGEWTLRLDGNPDGLKLEMPTTFALKRGDKQVVTIKRTKGGDRVGDEPDAGAKVGEVRRIHWSGGGRVFTTAISPDGRYYMAAGDPDRVRLWDRATGKQLHEFRGYIAYFTPDGKQVVTGSWAKSQFRVYDVRTGEEVRTFGGGGDLWNFRVSPDGKYVASLTSSKVIHVWDLATGKEIHRFAGKTMNLEFLFSSDGRRFVYSLDGKPRSVLNLETGEGVWEYANVVGKEKLYRFMPGEREVLGYRSGPTLQFYEVATGKRVRELDLGVGANFIPESQSADGRRLLAAYPDGTFRLWDCTTGKVLYRFAMIDGTNTKAAFISQDGRYASGISDNGSVYLWRLPDPSPAKAKP